MLCKYNKSSNYSQKEMDKLEQSGNQNLIGFAVDDKIYEEEDDD